MPFTVGGEWVPKKTPLKTSQKPVKVRVIKRGNKIVTVVLNLLLPPKELENMASSLKKHLGCGGSIKEEVIEIQGDKVAEVKKWLTTFGIKSS